MLALIASASPSAVLIAQVAPLAVPSDAGAPLAAARDAGAFAGKIVAVDYGTGRITVAARGRSRDFALLPSTQIQSDADGFRTIADLAVGTPVDVLASERDGVFTAQIVRLR